MNISNKDELSKKIGDVDAFLTLNICDVYFNQSKKIEEKNEDCLVNRYNCSFKDIEEEKIEKYLMYLDLISPLSGKEENKDLIAIRNAYIKSIYNVYKTTCSLDLMLECTEKYYEAYKVMEQKIYFNSNSIRDNINDEISKIKTITYLKNQKIIHI